MKMTSLVLIAAALLLAAPAVAQTPCLRIGQIYNFNAPDNRTLIVEDNLHQKFKVGLMGTCIGLTFKQNVGFKSQGATQLSCLAPADQVIVGQAGLGAQTCPIKSVDVYTPAMEAADKAAAAAKKNGGQ